MRKVTLGLANSLDNYIARKDGGSDWLHWSKEVAEISAKFICHRSVSPQQVLRNDCGGPVVY